jgi:hypothetical protein
MRHCRFLGCCAVAALLASCITSPPASPPPPRAFLDGRIHAVSRKDVREIIAAAKEYLARTGRVPQPIYSVHIEKSNMAFVYHGDQPKHAGDIEEFLIIEKINGHWQMGEREIVRGVNIPT